MGIDHWLSALQDGPATGGTLPTEPVTIRIDSVTMDDWSGESSGRADGEREKVRTGGNRAQAVLQGDPREPHWGCGGRHEPSRLDADAHPGAVSDAHALRRRGRGGAALVPVMARVVGGAAARAVVHASQDGWGRGDAKAERPGEQEGQAGA